MITMEQQVKSCSRCQANKPLGAFGPRKNRPSGVSSFCRDCDRKRQKSRRQSPGVKSQQSHYYTSHKDTLVAQSLHRRSRHADVLRSLKQQAPCGDCGSTYPPVCMDFDHVRGEKNTNLSDMKTYSLGVILREVQKCDLVCSNCHRLRTHSRRTPTQGSQKQKFNDRLRSLKSQPCSDCGLSYPPVVMDFDHVRGVKECDVGQMGGRAWRLVVEEIQKCDLVCSNCHRQRTSLRRGS
jgi:hypothetical protein